VCTSQFDTGASGIVLGGGLAKKAGVVKLADIPIHGWADKPGKNGYAGIVSSVKIRELEFENCPVLVVDRKSLGLTEGIIGADFFSAFLVDLDFPHKKLRLGDLPNWPSDDNDHGENQLRGLHDRYVAPEMQSYTPVYRFSQDLLVPATFGTAAPRLFLMDSGSPTNVAARDIASESGALRGRALLPLAGINGAIGDVHNAEKTELQFGGIDEQSQQAVVFDLAHQSKILGTEISGVIGFATLRHLDVKIDYRDGLVKFASESGKGK
jgi:gag-polyprotein putative aspartyl protease